MFRITGDNSNLTMSVQLNTVTVKTGIKEPVGDFLQKAEMTHIYFRWFLHQVLNW